MAYSVRSSTIDALSMVTPPTTNPSVSSSIFSSKMSGKSTRIGSVTSTVKKALKPLKKDMIWQRYKQKNAEIAKRHEEEVA